MAILPSHRQGLYYIEHCRVMAKDERIVYARQENAFTKFFAIPPANTNVILLGSGTSITQAAARMLAEEGVMVGFCGGGGTPLYLASQNEYRPTKYLQDWLRFWWDEDKRLMAAKYFQEERCKFLEQSWRRLQKPKPEKSVLQGIINVYLSRMENATNTQKLMGCEANFAKILYHCWVKALELEAFERQPGKKDMTDLYNSYLDHGNYLAYGLAATVLWVLGIPHSLPVTHGLTRRGALVFDLADIIKDSAIMPVAFQCASAKKPDNEMRQACTAMLDKTGALQYMFKSLQNVIEDLA
jgi:CRISPR-associated protein Cas1